VECRQLGSGGEKFQRPLSSFILAQGSNEMTNSK
jgi:hypothetical protein